MDISCCYFLKDTCKIAVSITINGCFNYYSFVNFSRVSIRINFFHSNFHSLREPLPSMLHKDFLRLTGKYKFTLAMENAICDDYITEKVWRPLEAGSVPIIFGSSKIKVNYFLYTALTGFINFSCS